jgi:hypothetical protein
MVKYDFYIKEPLGIVGWGLSVGFMIGDPKREWRGLPWSCREWWP